jgi:hypothetical protein
MPVPNQYVLTDPVAGEIAQLIEDGFEKEKIVNLCVKSAGYPENEIDRLENELRQLMREEAKNQKQKYGDYNMEPLFNQMKDADFSEKYYRLLNQTFRVSFTSAEAQFAVHPKFAHLQTQPKESVNHHFRVFHHKKQFALKVNEEWVGFWPQEREHFFTGMFSQKLLEKIYTKNGNEWMGVFHASAVSFENNCLLFAGNSGAGKSTLAALLFSRGFDVLADDFVPVESKTGRVFRFPAALSVKKGAVDLLGSSFKRLKKAKEYHLPKQQKTVKYLPVNHFNSNSVNHVPCSGLVFVDYKPNSGFQLEEIPPEEAFARLVPDSWIYPSEENSKRFMEWFSNLHFFKLNYSDNEKMVAEIKTLFQKTKPQAS